MNGSGAFVSQYVVKRRLLRVGCTPHANPKRGLANICLDKVHVSKQMTKCFNYAPVTVSSSTSSIDNLVICQHFITEKRAALPHALPEKQKIINILIFLHFASFDTVIIITLLYYTEFSECRSLPSASLFFQAPLKRARSFILCLSTLDGMILLEGKTFCLLLIKKTNQVYSQFLSWGNY